MVCLRVYMDYASTTPIDPRVLKVMIPFLKKKFGNPMSLHYYGFEAKKALEEARETVAKSMNANFNEIIFTSSATESNNLAIKGVAFANKDKGNHIIVSSIEHKCVLESAKWLEKFGFKVDYLPVDKDGVVDVEKLKSMIRKETILVSVMHANNEIGTIEPVEEIGKICKEEGVYFHSDAAQSFGKIQVDVKKFNVDLLTVSSHKMYGPKGVAALYLKEGTKIEPILHGGGHEFGLRASTVNVPAIVGFAEAVRIAEREMEEEGRRLRRFRDNIIKEVLDKIDDSHLNGHPLKRLPNNVNFWFGGVDGEVLVGILDEYGVCASSGSACHLTSLEPSHVLLAIGLRLEEAMGSLRLSMGRWTTKEEVDYVLEVLPKAVEKVRSLSKRR